MLLYMANNIEIKSEGRRHYLVGDTYPIKNAIKAAGCNWDRDRYAWWTGKLEVAQKLVAGVASGAVVAAARWVKLGSGFGVLVAAGSPAKTGSTIPVQSKDGGTRDVELASLVETKADGSRIYAVPPRKTAARTPTGPKQVGEVGGTLCSQFEASKHDRTPGLELGASKWIKDGKDRVAVVVIGWYAATWLSSDDAEDMGHYDVKSGYYGTLYYRRATLAEATALQAVSPREDAVMPTE